jgi:hypothetical protein
MTKQRINVGVAPNDKSGDPLRVAFSKINGMFDELYDVGSARVIVSDTVPTNPSTGTLWFNDTEGRLYIYYDRFWVDTNPAVGPTIPSMTGNAGKILSTNGSTMSWTNELDGGNASS